MVTFKFGRYEGPVFIGHYSNGRVALVWEINDGLSLAALSKNLVNESIDEDEVFIDENNLNFLAKDGEPLIIKSMIDQGILKERTGSAISGYCTYPKCTLTKKFIKTAELIS